MAKYNMSSWVDSLKGVHEKKPIPVLSFPCVSLLGITVRELISDSELQAKGMKAVADRTDAAASVSFMDLSVEAECFGAKVLFSETEVPTESEAPVETEAPAETEAPVETEAPAESLPSEPVYETITVVDEYSLTNRQLQTFYWMEVAAYMQAGHNEAPDLTQSLDTQVCPIDDSVGSWQQYFLQKALNTWATSRALNLHSQYVP